MAVGCSLLLAAALAGQPPQGVVLRLAPDPWHMPYGGDFAFAADGKTLAVSDGRDAVLSLRAVPGLNEVAAIPLGREPAGAMRFAAGGRRVAFGVGFEARVADVATAEILHTFRVEFLAVRPDGRRLATVDFG